MLTVWKSMAAAAAAMVVLGLAAGNATAEGVWIGEYETQQECLAAGERYRSSDTYPDCVYKRFGPWELWVRSIGG
ncbi:hypothetical protein ACWEKR_11315 [Nocardia sp. NPDC004573]